MDPDDEKEVNLLTRGNVRLLQYWASKIHFEKDYRYMSKNLIIQVLRAPYIVDIPPITYMNGTEELVLEEILPSAESLKRRKVKKAGELCKVCNEKPVKARGMCSTCYDRWWRQHKNSGTPEIPSTPKAPVTQTAEAAT